MVNKKMFAIRKRNGVNRIVQVAKSATGKNIYASDKRRCNGKTYRTKTMAKSALMRNKSGSAFGKKKSKRKRSRNKSKSKRFSFWNKYFVCPNPEEPNKIKICKATTLRFRGDKYKIVQTVPKNMYGEQQVVRLIDEDQKLFSSRESARKFAKTVNVLRMAGIHEISDVIPAEVLGIMVEEKRASFKNVKPGKRHKYSFKDVNVNNFRGKYSDPNYDIDNNIFGDLGKLGHRNAPGDVKLDGIGVVRGDLNDGNPLGLYSSEFRQRLKNRDQGIMGSLQLRRPSYFGRQRRTNYGFSRYF